MDNVESTPPADPFVFVGKVLKRNDDGSVDLRLIKDDMSIDVDEGDEFFTVSMVADPFTPSEDGE